MSAALTCRAGAWASELAPICSRSCRTWRYALYAMGARAGQTGTGGGLHLFATCSKLQHLSRTQAPLCSNCFFASDALPSVASVQGLFRGHYTRARGAALRPSRAPAQSLDKKGSFKKFPAGFPGRFSPLYDCVKKSYKIIAGIVYWLANNIYLSFVRA